MFMNMMRLDSCEQLWVFGDRAADGMAKEMDKARKQQMLFRNFMDECKETTYGNIKCD